MTHKLLNVPESIRAHIAALEKERDATIADNEALLAAIHLPTLRFAAEVLGAKQPDVRRRLEELMLLKNRPHPGATLLEEHRKALVRARNEGLEKAAVKAESAREHGCDPYAPCTCDWQQRVRWMPDDVRAMKEPES